MRDRVTVFAETVADRLAIDGGRAVAIVCRTREGTHTVEGDRFVLCAGTFASPGVLARSGIGPPAVLERLSVPLQVRADGVGANLHDHCGLAVRFAPSVDAAEALAADLARGTFHQSQVVLRTRDLHLAPFHGRADDGWSFVILAFNLAPRSRGVVEPNADALASPTIDYRFLSDPGGRDAQALEDGLALVRALVRHPPLADAVARELGIVLTGYAHAVGTCRLGAVVDPTCRLSGINNVYVADASIIPTIPRTNPNLLCFLIGHRAAELIDGLSDARRRAN